MKTQTAHNQEYEPDTDEEAQDRLKAHHLKMHYEDFIMRRDLLRRQAQELSV